MSAEPSWEDVPAIPNPLYTEHFYARAASQSQNRPASHPRVNSQQSSSQSHSSYHKKRRNPNDAPSRSANTQVISTMIDALGNLTPPTDIERNKFFEVHNADSSHNAMSEQPISQSSTWYAGSVPPSVSRSRHSVSSPPYDQSFPGSLEAEADDSADFPVIRTTRRPSERSQRSGDSTSLSFGFRQLVRSASIRSRSSISIQSLGEDWEIHSPARDSEAQTATRRGPSSLQDRGLTALPVWNDFYPADRSTSVTPSVVDTREENRADSTNAHLNRPQFEGVVIVKPYASSQAPQRLVVRDDSPQQRHHAKTVKKPLKSSRDQATSQKTLPEPGSNRTSPAKSLIADAIPLRTSSLNQADAQHLEKKSKLRKDRSSSNHSGKRDKGKRKKLPLSEDVLDELGEEDETVKRIKELKLQREARMKSSLQDEQGEEVERNTSVSSLDEPGHTQAADPHSWPVVENDIAGRAPYRTPTSNKGGARPNDDSKARRVLGFDARPDMSPAKSVLTPTRSSQQRWVNARVGADESYSRNPPTLDLSPLGLSIGFGEHARAGRPQLYSANSEQLTSPSSIDRRPRPLATATVRSFSRPSTAARTQSMSALGSMGAGVVTGIGDGQNHYNNRNSIVVSESERSNQSSPLRRRKIVRSPDSDHRRQTQVWSDAFPEEAEEERRRSVDDAVESFLRDRRLSQAVRHPKTGRKIAFSEVGDPNGAVVFVCVGMGLTRFVSTFYDDLALTLKLRLITPDRPGVGGSEPYPERERQGPMTWHQDVATICQHLDISQFSVLAHSAGAIYALATALVLPHFVHGKVHLLAPWIPPSQFQSYSPRTGSDVLPVGSLPRTQRFLRVLPTSLLKAANANFLGVNNEAQSPSSKQKSPNKIESPFRDKKSRESISPDPTLMARRQSLIGMEQMLAPQNGGFGFPISKAIGTAIPSSTDSETETIRLSATATPTEADFYYASSALHAAEHAERERSSAYNSRLTERTWELATKNSNPTVDLLVCLERSRNVGFRYVDVQRKIAITHGSDDKRVPIENVNWLADQINRRTPAMIEPDSDRDDMYQRSGCDVRVLPGEGHGLMASAIVMADVLSEIAREWRVSNHQRISSR